MPNAPRGSWMRPVGGAARLSPALLVVGFVLTAQAGAADPQPVVVAPAKTTMTLSLPECLQLALERQPRIAAQRASLAAAQDGQRALDALRIPTLIDRELTVRRQQAALGVDAATAGLDQAVRESNYAVTRTYFTVIYAREQERVARGIVDRLTAIQRVAEDQVKAGARNTTAADVDRTRVYLRLAEVKRRQAEQGVKRAAAALREAIGLGPEVTVNVPAGALPEPKATPNEDEIVALALSRRAELTRADIFARVTCLEAEAQDLNRHVRVQTFASGSDIHSVAVPQVLRDTEYRPGGVPPEMPDLLAGARSERVKHAESLHARADALVEVTRNLITLEATDAFLRWQETADEAAKAKEAADTGDKLANDLDRDFTAGLKVRVEDAVNARVLAAQAQSQYHDYLYREILALADLERITAGGFVAGLTAAAPPSKPAPADNGK